MTGARRSGRYSARVEPPTATAPVGQASGAASAPESLTQLVACTSTAHPERDGRPARTERLSDDVLHRLSRNLSDRDRAVLHSLSTYRFLTTSQLRLFHFTDHLNETAAARVCRRVLARLRALGVIEELERRIGGVRAGSEAFVWRVGRVGDRLLQLGRGDGIRARRKEPSTRFLDHCLDIASTHLQLLTAARAGHFELLDVTAEPRTWRSYLGPGSERLTLKPDLLATTALGSFEDAWAFEVDEGTESLPTLLRKCAQYEAYRATGQEQDAAGVFPIVVWIVPMESRAARLKRAIARAPRLDASLYRVCTPERLLDVVQEGAA